MHHPGFQLIADLSQERLVDWGYLVHCFDSTINELISCRLAFESGRHLVIRNAADGESLIIENRDPEEMDLGQYGTTKLVSSLEYDPAQSRACVGRRLDRCRLICGDDRIYAVELSFEGRSISLYNRDDELVTEGAISDVDAPEGARLVEMP
jgi:hypothetical protein